MSECGEDSCAMVTHEGETIFFFCDVDDDTVKELCSLLKKLSRTYDTIKIAIRSGGGDLYAGFAGMDYIRTLTKKGLTIETIAYGFCASAATFLLLAGTKRLMGENSFILIHQLSVEGTGGCYSELMADMKINKQLMKHFRKVYNKYAEIPEEVLEKLLSKDVILSAEKCLKYQIVDEVF
jgi:ATP-dependent protease ClpP protease subunit